MVFFDIETSEYGDVETEVRCQALKAARAACLNHSICHNKYIGIETKSRIYKRAITPILTYTTETRPKTSKMTQML